MLKFTSTKLIHKKTGFTLIELLVVISIIALLLSIMMPALNKARKKAQSIACSGNMKQIGIALAAYVAEHKDDMPSLLERHWGSSLVSGLAGGGRGYYWAGLINQSKVMAMTAFKCAGDKRKYTLDENSFLVPPPGGAEQGFDYAAVFMGYGVPPTGGDRRTPWSMPSGGSNIAAKNVGPWKSFKIPTPAKMHMVWDGAAPAMSDGIGVAHFIYEMNQYLKRTKPMDYSLFYNQTIFRHSTKRITNVTDLSAGGPNVVFADGHVEQNVKIGQLTEDQCSIK